MGNRDEFSAFLIAGTNSGCGKTTLTLGMLRALSRRGLRVAPFKCGPDYIDPAFHAAAAGRESYNLDTVFGSEGDYAAAAHADAAVVEGVMGLFDGIAPGDLRGSCADIARRLGLPVLLAVNARGLSGSIAPLVKGFAGWHPEVRIAGVIANNVGSPRHARLLADALRAAGLPPLVGFLERDSRLTLPERHLGLSLDMPDDRWLDELADAMVTKIVGIESRGFVMASALAGRLGCGIVLARKPGKLPATVIKESFSKEYGVDTVEMHIDSIDENDVVLIHDDLLATGGTAKAVYNLVEHFHPKKVYMNFIIEIKDEGLHGRDLFKDIDLTTLLTI